MPTYFHDVMIAGGSVHDAGHGSALSRLWELPAKASTSPADPPGGWFTGPPTIYHPPSHLAFHLPVS